MLAISFLSLRRTGRALSAMASMIILTGIASAPATAATATASFAVTATVAPACTLSATNLAFGTYTGAQTDGTSALTVNCTNSTAYSIGLGLGTTNSTVANRLMVNQAAVSLLSYALYQSAARTVLWGFSGTDLVSGTGTGSVQALTVFGRIPAGQTTNALGAYTDTIVATITF